MQGILLTNYGGGGFCLFVNVFFILFFFKDSIWVEKGKICMTAMVNCFGE